MKTNIYTLTSRSMIVALAFASLLFITSCGSNGISEETIAEETLSDKTTPVTFVIDNGPFYMFDYSGSRYIGSDTVEIWNGRTDLKNDVEINLRQGNHHVLWISNLTKYYYSGTSLEPYNYPEIHFNPNSKIITATGKDPFKYKGVGYAELDLSVKEYLLPKQEVTLKPLTAKIRVEVLDYSNSTKSNYKKTSAIGIMKGYPYVSSISLFGDTYALKENSSDYNLELNDSQANNTISNSPTQSLISSYQYIYEIDHVASIISKVSVQDSHYILCPVQGLENIQLYAEVQDVNGNTIPTTTLPKISLRRGYTTVLRGPLFSGSTSDWEVSMEKYTE